MKYIYFKISERDGVFPPSQAFQSNLIHYLMVVEQQTIILYDLHRILLNVVLNVMNGVNTPSSLKQCNPFQLYSLTGQIQDSRRVSQLIAQSLPLSRFF